MTLIHLGDSKTESFANESYRALMTHSAHFLLIYPMTSAPAVEIPYGPGTVESFSFVLSLQKSCHCGLNLLIENRKDVTLSSEVPEHSADVFREQKRFPRKSTVPGRVPFQNSHPISETCLPTSTVCPSSLRFSQLQIFMHLLWFYVIL